MNTAKDLRIEIERARESLNNTLTFYIDSETDNAQTSYKRMLDHQRKSLEELIKLYWSVRDSDEDDDTVIFTDERNGSKWVHKP